MFGVVLHSIATENVNTARMTEKEREEIPNFMRCSEEMMRRERERGHYLKHFISKSSMLIFIFLTVFLRKEKY